jgi:dolichyl-phosphate beta-glucosyltransferase
LTEYVSAIHEPKDGTVISLVLPTYNPGPTIEQSWLAVSQFIAMRARLSDTWEALFVLDGCTDGTHERLQKLNSAQDHRIRVLSYPQNRGKGYAVRSGLLAAEGSIRIFTDVDLAYPFEDILRVADAIRDGAAVAIGSRIHPDSRIQLPSRILGYAFRRALQGKIFGAIARLLLPISVYDTQAGLKGMNAAVAISLLPHLTCDGFGFDCELLTACARVGISPSEVPVCVQYDGLTTTSPRSGMRMLHELWRIRRTWQTKALAIQWSAGASPDGATRTQPPAAA